MNSNILRVHVLHQYVLCAVGDTSGTRQMDHRHEGERRHERLLANVLVEKERLLPLLVEGRRSLPTYYYAGVGDVPYLF